MEADLLLYFDSARDRIHGFVHARQLLSTKHIHSICELLHVCVRAHEGVPCASMQLNVEARSQLWVPYLDF